MGSDGGGASARCETCGSIGSASAMWKGGVAQYNDLPAEQARLEIVGAPYFHDRYEGSRNRCLKRCPACGAYFLWKLDYEFLVGGTEDEVSLERLEPSEGQALAERMLAEKASADEGFRASVRPLLACLERGPDQPRFREAISLIDRAQTSGIDVRVALPSVVRALLGSGRREDAGSARYDLVRILSQHCASGAEASAEVLRLLDEPASAAASATATPAASDRVDPAATAPSADSPDAGHTGQESVEVERLRCWATRFRDLVPFGLMGCRSEVSALLEALDRGGRKGRGRSRAASAAPSRLSAPGLSTAALSKQAIVAVPSMTEQRVDTLLWILVRLGHVDCERGLFALKPAGRDWVARLRGAGFLLPPG